MTIVYYPKLRPADYDAFQAVLHPDLPNTYNEWFDLARKEMREIIVNGDTPIDVEIDPHEFAQYCHTTRSARTLDSLKQCVAQKRRNKTD